MTGPAEDRLLMTGVHTVADLCCAGCRALLGWKYVSAGVCGVGGCRWGLDLCGGGVCGGR